MACQLASGYVSVMLLLLLALMTSELDKKQAGLLQRCENEATTLEASLEKAGSERYTERQDGDFKRRIDKLADKAAPLPADDEGVKKLLAHLAALRAKHGDLGAKLSGAMQAKSDEKAAIAALVEAPEFADDVAEMETFAAMFQDSGRFAPDHYLYARWPAHSLVAETKAWAANWPATQKKVAELQAKYKAAADYRGKLEGKAQMGQTKLTIAMREMNERVEDFAAAVTRFAKSGGSDIEKATQALDASIADAVSRKAYPDFTIWDSKLSQAHCRVLNLVAVWAPLASADADRTAAEAKAKSADDKLANAAEKLSTDIIRENRAPADQWQGDRSAVEAFVKKEYAKKYPNEEILSVRFAGPAFERRTFWELDSTRTKLVKRDESSVGAWVLVKDAAKKEAVQWYTTLYKLHMKGDALYLEPGMRTSRMPMPSQRILLANYK